MNDGAQAGNFVIKGVVVLAAQLYQLRRVTGRVVGSKARASRDLERRENEKTDLS